MSHLLTTPLTIDSAPFLASPLPPLPPHPYAHHTRSPCSSDTCIFLTNIPLLPPPDAIPYPGPEVVQSLDEWENHLGWTARGWREHGGDGAEVWGEEEGWAKDWPHAAAVDGREGTAFRSRDGTFCERDCLCEARADSLTPVVTQSEDYIALGLLTALDSSWVPRVDFVFTLEQGEAVLQGAAMVVEVSADGYRWVSSPTSRPQVIRSPS